MDAVTRARMVAFCVFWLGFAISILMCNVWPNAGDAYFFATASWVLHAVRRAIPALFIKLFKRP